MKKVITILLTLSFLAGAATFTRAADGDDAKKKAADRRAEALKKYDKNGDGKLDENERAAMREDRKKAGEKKKDAPKKDEAK